MAFKILPKCLKASGLTMASVLAAAKHDVSAGARTLDTPRAQLLLSACASIWLLLAPLFLGLISLPCVLVAVAYNFELPGVDCDCPPYKQLLWLQVFISNPLQQVSSVLDVDLRPAHACGVSGRCWALVASCTATCCCLSHHFDLLVLWVIEKLTFV
jgi:hypothetical protein